VRYELEFEETFAGERLDDARWVPHYLPQWSSRAASRARYSLGGGQLRLRIDEDQPPSPCGSSGTRTARSARRRSA
jgi:hypothetical protein